MKLGRLNHSEVATPSIVNSIIFCQDIGYPTKVAERIWEYEDRFAKPFVAASRGFIDEVIHPRNTRRRIALGLERIEE